MLEKNNTPKSDFINQNRKRLLESTHSESSFEVNMKPVQPVENKGGDKPFRCCNCGEGFSRQYNLKRHRLKSCVSQQEQKQSVKKSSTDFDIIEGSPCMAVLKALAFNTDDTTCLLKKDLIAKAQQFTNKQLQMKDCTNIGDYANTWQKINTMLSKGFLMKRGTPIQYSITLKGREIVDRMGKEEKVSDADTIPDNKDRNLSLSVSSEKEEKVSDADDITDDEDSNSSLNHSISFESNDETFLSDTLEAKNKQKLNKFEKYSTLECQGCKNQINGHICDDETSVPKTLEAKKNKIFKEFEAENKRVPILIQQEKNKNNLLSLISAALPPSSIKSSKRGTSTKTVTWLENSTRRRSKRERVLRCRNIACRQQFSSTVERDQHCIESLSCNFEYYD